MVNAVSAAKKEIVPFDMHNLAKRKVVHPVTRHHEKFRVDREPQKNTFICDPSDCAGAVSRIDGRLARFCAMPAVFADNHPYKKAGHCRQKNQRQQGKIVSLHTADASQPGALSSNLRRFLACVVSAIWISI